MVFLIKMLVTRSTGESGWKAKPPDSAFAPPNKSAGQLPAAKFCTDLRTGTKVNPAVYLSP